MPYRRQRYKQRTYDHELTLISETIVYDDIGSPITVEKRTDILCDLDSVGRNEFYDAASQGLKPEKVFTIHSFEYSGETIVEFENVRYKVLRTYGEGTEEIELTCERL